LIGQNSGFFFFHKQSGVSTNRFTVSLKLTAHQPDYWPILTNSNLFITIHNRKNVDSILGRKKIGQIFYTIPITFSEF